MLNLGYTYDARGNTTKITNYLDNAKSQTLTYDALDRLRSFRGVWGNGSFAYDPVGNRTRKTVAGRAGSYAYTSNRLSSLGGIAPEIYTYYGNGALKTRRKGGVSYTFTYDGFGNLVKYARGQTTLAALAYNGDGRRVRKTAGGKTTIYHYDLAGRILAETDAAGRVLAEYIYANNALVAQRNATGGVRYYHTDPLGTPHAMTNANGQMVWRAEYLPFGEAHTVSATPPNTKRFLAKEYDPEMELADLGARALASDLGRFLTPDPVRVVDPITSRERMAIVMDPQRLQLYSYGLNNPSRYVDLDGEFALVPLALAVWAVAEIVLAVSDAYDTAQTMASPETSLLEKDVAGGLFAAGAMLPGGGYAQVDDVAKAGMKRVAQRLNESLDELSSSGQLLDPADRAGQLPSTAYRT